MDAMVDASLYTGMTAIVLSICALTPPVTGVVQTPNKDSGVHATRRETMHQDHGWWRRDRLNGKTDICTDGLAQVVERRADPLAHGGRGRGHAKCPQTTVVSGQVGHRGEQGTRRAERVCYTSQFH